jgi:adenylate kinase
MLLSRLIATGVAGAGGATVFGFSYSSEKKRQESQINGGKWMLLS